ncbi:hypothetical protein SAMN05428959_103132 [Duganella sp. CF517]|uniref:hypothetical protein n=1 Tax=Duganella sp. CF517 TaxID=1881038 RepID=UPI0008BE7AD1|nr:hypothetical protein [Duganella sp. CF517]SEN78943.1 hypothetical protein SAMN05428959_103132 [Duganella sp. CF517]
MPQPRRLPHSARLALTMGATFYLISASPATCAEPVAVQPRDALTASFMGLYPGTDFRVTRADCNDCPEAPQALWYFGDDTVAVAGKNAVGSTPHLRAQDDVRAWLAATSAKAQGKPPQLLWIGSPQVAEGRLAADAASLLGTGADAALPVALAARLASNRSYFDASSKAYFAGSGIKARGVLKDGTFHARTLWPKDYALSALPVLAPLKNGESIESLVRANGGGARDPFAARTLWRRGGAVAADVPLAGKPALAFILNGAQGDDDEAHGGHFAVATGRFDPHGGWDNWLVNNFYNLGSVSEKGIIASSLPMDAYMADLNSGQSWYRPSYMLVAVMKDQRVPALYQEAISRVFNHFYSQDFHYRHAGTNCAGINVETLRTLGWGIPRLGGESPLKAAVALPFMALKEVSLASGQSAYDYLKTERTELLPFVAFNTIGEDLLNRLTTKDGPRGAIEAQLADDLEAIVFVRIPQFPSSRAFGSDPVMSLSEYQKRAPADRADWKIIPVGPREFPASMKNPLAPKEKRPQSVTATYILAAGVLCLSGGVAMAWRRRRQKVCSRTDN